MPESSRGTLVLIEPWEGVWLARVCVRRAGRLRTVGAFAGSEALVRRVASVATLHREVSVDELAELADELRTNFDERLVSKRISTNGQRGGR